MHIANPESLGFSSERLERINAVMQRYVDEKKLAGVITCVARRGEIVHWGKVGMADIAAGRLMADDTIFRIYSMTKPITSAAVLMLLEEGRLRLGDPVAQYIPAFKDVQVLDSIVEGEVRCVPCARPITLHDLLTHTAGLNYGGAPLEDLYGQHIWPHLQNDPKLTLAEFVEAIAALPLACQPGTRFLYSLAFDVLGLVVQVASGMPFEQFLKQRILEPLGMVDTDFYVPADKRERLAQVYSRDPEQGLKVNQERPFDDHTTPPASPSGGGGMVATGGGLVSTTGDYLRFAQMLLNRGELGGVRLLGRKTVEWMTVNHLPAGLHPFDDSAMGWGLGVSVLTDLGQSRVLGSVGNYGWIGGANTNFWVDPQEELIGLLMLQFMPIGTYPVTSDFRNLTYQALVA